jgi:hypothetical protein
MNCNNCDFAAKIKEAEHSGVRFEDTPCATCELTEDSSHTMAFDEERAVPPAVLPEYPADRADVLPLSVLAEALRGFLELPHRTFRIVQRRYKGDSYAVIAKELQVTPQAVEIQLRRALEAHPHLKQLLPEKARRQAARKRKRLSMARRGKAGSR